MGLLMDKILYHQCPNLRRIALMNSVEPNRWRKLVREKKITGMTQGGASQVWIMAPWLNWSVTRLKYVTSTPPKFNIYSPWKNDGWEDDPASFLGQQMFRVYVKLPGSMKLATSLILWYKYLDVYSVQSRVVGKVPNSYSLHPPTQAQKCTTNHLNTLLAPTQLST